MDAGSLTPQALARGRLFIVAELTVAGILIRAATDELAITRAATSEAVAVSRYLSRPIVVTLNAGYGEAQNEPASAQFELSILGPLADLHAAGVLLGGLGEAVVFAWVEGTDYDEREILLTGRISIGEIGPLGSALVVSVKQDDGRVSASFPGIGEVLDDSPASVGGATAYDGAVGTPYPFPFGRPPLTTGMLEAPATSPAIPHTIVTATGDVAVLVVAGGLVDAAQVDVFDKDGAQDALTITYRQDGRGQTFARCVLGSSYAGPLNVTDGAPYLCRWTNGRGRLHDGEPIDGAGQLIEHLLRASGRAHDAARTAGARAQLDVYKVAGCIDEPVRALDYIGDALAAVLPFTLTSGPRGFYPWPWPLNPALSEALAVLDAGEPGVSRSSELSADDGDVINEARLAFAVDRRTDATLSAFSVGAIGSGADLELDALTASQRDHGVRVWAEESVVVYDAGTAARALIALVSVKGTPRQRVSYDLAPGLAWLRPGAIVRVTDADLSLDALAVLDTLTLSENVAGADLIILRRLT